MGAAERTGKRRLDVLHPVRHRVPVEVSGPRGRVFPSAEPRRRGPGERAQHVRVYASVPRDHRVRTPSSPTLVDEAIDLAHVQAAHLRGPPFAADHAYGVCLPVDDVDERILDRPRIPRGRARDVPPPVRRAQPSHQAVEQGELAPGSREDTLPRVPHVKDVTAPQGSATTPCFNLSVFYRLGAVGVFFRDRLGYEVPWCRAFPFSWVAHLQYVGQAGERSWRRDMKLFYGWVIVGVGIVVTCIGLGAMSSLSVFLQPMSQAMGGPARASPPPRS
jgi:hypothetical protein